jgi:5-methyltetrahydrofolate--homocysteine methyltransferase
MIIIGELINSTRKKIRAFIEQHDSEAIKDIALKQVEAGADYLDVNAGAFVTNEPEQMEWLVKTVRSVTEIPLCIDSPSHGALDVGLQLAGPNAIINSISGEPERYEKVIPLVQKYDASVIALSMDERGILDDEEQILGVIDKLVGRLKDDQVPPERIYIDPLIRPVSTNTTYGNLALRTLAEVTRRYPDVRTSCGVSNVSYGLPKRKLLNQTLMVMAIARGLKAAIIDPLDKQLMANIIAAEALFGEDEFCMRYLEADRSGRFEGLV